MFHVIMMFLSGLSSPLGTLVIDAQAWPAPQQTEVLLGRPEVTGFLRRVTARDYHHLVVRHAGGDAGRIMAEQLRDTLVAVGIPSDRIRLEPAAAAPGELVLEIVIPERVIP